MISSIEHYNCALFEENDLLQQAVRQTYLDADHSRKQNQMATPTRTHAYEQSGESVDVYLTEARAKIADQNYDENLQMTLLHGLRPDIKGLDP